jgi:hypothetical protein
MTDEEPNWQDIFQAALEGLLIECHLLCSDGCLSFSRLDSSVVGENSCGRLGILVEWGNFYREFLEKDIDRALRACEFCHRAVKKQMITGHRIRRH